MSAILHASGFCRNNKATGVDVTMYEGTLAEVAKEVIRGIKSHGHEAKVSTLRPIGGGELVEVRVTVYINGERMWHVFKQPGEQWTRK